MAHERDSKRRKLSLSKHSSIPEHRYIVESHVLLQDSKECPKPWKCGLNTDDKKVFETSAWLTDNIITAAQNLLAQHFGTDGLQDVTLARTLSMAVKRRGFVQILNQSSSHWITVSTIGCQPAFVKVYDSAGKYLTYRNKEEIAALLFTPEHNITVAFMNVQQQTGVQDCGLFAIAFATALCQGVDPTTCSFNQSTMRNHLLQCFESGTMSAFPHRSRRTIAAPSKVTDFDVYCNCRMPHNKNLKPQESMIMCSRCIEWFHEGCVTKTIPANYWDLSKKALKWYCQECIKKRP